MTTLRLRILFDSLVIGPGKAELLGRIRDTGSIAAAGRQMDMSYKRAWMLVEEMNAAFVEPLVLSARGGAKGGGAQLTGAGEKVLALYHEIVATAECTTANEIAALRSMLRTSDERDIPDGK